MSLASAAVEYAKAGWTVFPLKPGGKDPLLKGGVNASSRDPDKVAGWWRKHPDANIGLALKASGLGCIDLDCHDKNANGLDTFRDLKLIYGSWPANGHVQSTPSGGRHLLFHRNGQPLVDKVKWEKGVDVLTKEHRYIVVSPSRLANGRAYEWEEGNWRKPAVPLPEGWGHALEGDKETDKSVRQEADLLDIAALRVSGVSLDQLDSILADLDPSMSRDEWLRVLWGAASQWKGTKNESVVLAKLDEWSSKTSKAGQYKPGEVRSRWNEHDAGKGRCVTWRSVQSMAKANGWSPFTLGGVTSLNWKDKLKKKMVEEHEIVVANAWNCSLFLAFHRDFAGNIKKNMLTNVIEIHSAKVCPLLDCTKLPVAWDKESDWVGVGQALDGMMHGMVTRDMIIAGVRNAAAIHAYDPMRDWLDSLEWDGVPRIDGWLTKVCNAPNTPLNLAIGRAWLVGLATRAGCQEKVGTKMDSMLILQGHEGIGKSTLGAILGGEWYVSFTDSLEKDDIYYSMEGAMVMEFEELDSMTRADVSRVKSIVTRQGDKFRRKYEAVADTRPRRCVYIGTTNDIQFLNRDMTMRRWWIVHCPPQMFNLRWLRDNRDQLIAEARDMAVGGELPVLPKEVQDAHREVVEAAQSEYPYEESIVEWSETQERGTRTNTKEVVEKVLGLAMNAMQPPALRMVNKCLRFAGWEKHKYNTKRFWVKNT